MEITKILLVYLSNILKVIENIFSALWRDLKAVAFFYRMKSVFAKKEFSVPLLFNKNLKKYKKKSCVEFYDITWTFEEVNFNI
jgi:hypothetical protein